MGAQQGEHHQHGADRLRKDGGNRGAGHAHLQAHHQQHVQHDVNHAGADEEVQRPPGIAHGTKQARTHVIDERRNHAGKVDAHIHLGMDQHILRGTHPAQNHRGKHDAQHREQRAPRQRHRGGGMYRLADLAVAPPAVELREDDRRPGGKAHKEAHHQVDQRACGASHGGQRFLAYEFAHNHGIGSVIQLLEEGSEQDGKEECQQVFPDYALGDAVLAELMPLEKRHRNPPQ